MKPTMSNDGLLRLTLAVKHRVGLDELIDGLGWKIAKECDFSSATLPAQEVEKQLRIHSSRSAILRATREAFTSEGHGFWTWSEDVQHGDIIRQQVRALVIEKFPELQPKSKL